MSTTSAAAVAVRSAAPRDFAEFDPAPPAPTGELKPAQGGSALLALDRAATYLFAEAGGQIGHRYDFPDDSDVFNCGGYLDKVLQYRAPALAAHLRRHGVAKPTFDDGTFPLLASRSPQLDLLILRMVLALRAERPGRRVSLFDLGCTVAEHFDLLDVMLRAATGDRDDAAAALSYHGIDISPLVLFAARYIHGGLDPEHFRLGLVEGSGFEAPPATYDIGLSVGVIHNLKDPVGGTQRLLRVSGVGTVLACWVCNSQTGFWLTSHHAAPIYIFGLDDLRTLAGTVPDRKLLVADFIPEAQSTQQPRFVGISQEAVDSIGCYHMVVTARTDLFPELSALSP